MDTYSSKVRRLDHAAYRCRDTEETRQFYEDILGMRLSTALEISATKTDRPVRIMHSFFEMDDNSFVAFFEDPDTQDESMFEKKDDFDLHLALRVDNMDTLLEYKLKLEGAGYEVRGPSNHGFVQSIYCYDPNGYVLELTTPTAEYDDIMSRGTQNAHTDLEHWQATKRPAKG